MQERDYARAVPLLQRAAHLAPQLGVLHSNLGEGLRRLGRKSEALSAFLLAMQANPEIAEVDYNLALTHDQLGHLPEAIATYGAALELKRSFAPAALGLLNALRANAEYGRAIEWYGQHAGELAGDLERLTKLRRSLRKTLEHSPLMDAPRFARALERAYDKLLKRGYRSESSFNSHA